MDGFGTIRLHLRTIKRFKGFSRKITRSYSKTLEVMMDFFEWHGVSPESKFPKRIDEDGEKTRKRINGLIAILRDIEKTQTLPTNTMLLSLFGEKVKQEKPKLVEKKKQKSNKKEEMISKYWYEKLKEIRKEEREDVLKFLLKVERFKPRFGNPYWRIDTNATELAKLKNKMQRD
ncbi:MAG: BfmA/BtgA family mobilization protein [Maribacter sp.]